MRFLASLLIASIGATIPIASGPPLLAQSVFSVTSEWPRTDFTKRGVELSEIRSGGPPKDGIPSIDTPKFIAATEDKDLVPREPVIALAIGADARAYPLRILMWHEIVNDVVGGVPVIVTYCPLCNPALVFRRDVNGQVLDASQLSVLDAEEIPNGRDIGNVVAQRRSGGGFIDIVYDVTFAFAFNAFHPNAPIVTE